MLSKLTGEERPLGLVIPRLIAAPPLRALENLRVEPTELVPPAVKFAVKLFRIRTDSPAVDIYSSK